MSVNRLEALMLDIDASLGRLEEEEQPSDLGSPLSPAAGDPDKKGCTVNELLDALFMFSSSAPTEQCLDVFKLSESLLMIANIQAAVALPLAFEIRDEVQSWILCAQTKTSKSLWIEMIHAVISKLPTHIHGESIQNVAMNAVNTTNGGGGSSDLDFHPTGLPLSPQRAHPPRNQSQQNSDYAAYTLNQDRMLASTSTRQSLPPYSLIERGNGSFINAGFGVSESDGDVSPVVPNSRMDLSRGGSGSSSAATTGLVAKKKKMNKYLGVFGLDPDILGA
ncbi:hypothetical protein HDU77_008981 [Chytriomyces hyalinus]|nr:hypothetical protein HDU77_008981 [Chytriomyces hyalinus]